jgi:hypothetical protein
LCLIDALLELVAVLVGTSVCASFGVNAPTRVTRRVDSETGSDDGFAALRQLVRICLMTGYPLADVPPNRSTPRSALRT